MVGVEGDRFKKFQISSGLVELYNGINLKTMNIVFIVSFAQALH